MFSSDDGIVVVRFEILAMPRKFSVDEYLALAETNRPQETPSPRCRRDIACRRRAGCR
jgi:hypothetical protein